ncbi:hypothetical protein F511_39631 [Dorcoceras hygrometricum]|uniref:Uncharacterized protein n=1 Tax=Dorcoceras hygrometricum TaxID=472368 RepID=A0A2Z7CAW7_9LAMI|nr:hypothetical protein F511_39631 [Dorcoceras hygrometricum]
MSSIKNPLDAILDSNKFTGLNYQDWLRNLNIVLASEKLLYTLDKSPPKEAPADISPEELSLSATQLHLVIWPESTNNPITSYEKL